MRTRQIAGDVQRTRKTNAQRITRSVQPGHDRTDWNIEPLRYVLIRKPLDADEAEDVALLGRKGRHRVIEFVHLSRIELAGSDRQLILETIQIDLDAAPCVARVIIGDNVAHDASEIPAPIVDFPTLADVKDGSQQGFLNHIFGICGIADEPAGSLVHGLGMLPSAGGGDRHSNFLFIAIRTGLVPDHAFAVRRLDSYVGRKR